MNKFLLKKLRYSLLLLTLFMLLFYCVVPHITFAMPFYGLAPSERVLRAEFSTIYNTSSNERKINIFLASKSLNNYFVDVNAEFSFNKAVGERTEKRGYKQAKIIFNGEFVDGVGGGVCQVSTTLYNAVLLSGLNVIEYHPHSLPVSYVLPSFDAMVNSANADLKFVNNTKNPIIIKTIADGNKLTVKIFGEPMTERYERKSEIIEKIAPPKEEIIIDEKGEFPHLHEGEYEFISYSKGGYKSKGYLITWHNGKASKQKQIRSDYYRAVKGKVVYGTTPKEPLSYPEKVLLFK